MSSTPESLYQVNPQVAAMISAEPRPLIMIHALAGFVDAGSSAELAAKHLLGDDPGEPLVEFDADLLIDYRARRPRMSFATDRFTEVHLPEIRLDLLHDQEDTPYLLLSGLEPDVQWRRFTKVVVGLCGRFGVQLAVGMHAIPWAAPHTRPVGLTPHATSRSLIAGRPRWVGDIEVPGSIDSLLELRLGEAEVPACGFAAHVPHYLTGTDYPPASVALLEAITETTGLQWEVSALKESGAQVLAEIDRQVTDSPETAEAVGQLEEQYDSQEAGESKGGLPSPHLPEDELVGEDMLVADFEQYLRDFGDEPPQI